MKKQLLILFSALSLSMFSFGQTSYSYSMDTLTANRSVSLNMTNGDDLTVSTSYDALVSFNGVAQPQISNAVNYYNLIDASDIDFTLVVDNGIYMLTVVVDVSLANVLETSKVDFTVYPNPTNDLLNIKADNISLVEIYDLSGKLLLTSADKSIDVSALVHGVYTIVLNSEMRMNFIKK